jgi:hypothetical protein
MAVWDRLVMSIMSSPVASRRRRIQKLSLNEGNGVDHETFMLRPVVISMKTRAGSAK